MSIVPHVNGEPLSKERTTRIFEAVTGEMYTDWSARALRHPEDAAALAHEQAGEDAKVRRVVLSFLERAKALLDLPDEVIAFHEFPDDQVPAA